MEQIAWFYGDDPARDADYHAIVINGLKPKPKTGQWLPMLKKIYKYKHTKYLDVLNFLFNDLFKKMRPMRFAVDASRDPTWAELLTKKLGEEKTISYKFTQDSKLHLMTINRNYLIAGYTIPDADKLLREQKITALDADNIKELKRQSLREQVIPSRNDKISFSDGGKHNDILHAQGLSLKACFDFQMIRGGFGQHSSLAGFDGSAASLYEPDKIEMKKKGMEALIAAKSKFDKLSIKYSSDL